MVAMDPLSLNTSKLTRSNTNDSNSEESLFSRQTSSSSLASPSPWRSATKLSQLCDLTTTQSQEDNTTSTIDNTSTSSGASTSTIAAINKEQAENSNLAGINLNALKIALTKIRSNNEETILQNQFDATHMLTTTPQEQVTYSKWCIILVGLPASGKSSIVNQLISKISQELPSLKADTFNAGNFRRNLTDLHQNASFFDFNNKEAKKQRDLFASLALDHLLNSLVNDSLDIGIFDATNSTVERREKIIRSIEEKEKLCHGSVKINKVILHVQIDDEKLLNFNIEGKTKNQDYNDQEHDVARNDFIKRLEMYRSAFQEITKEELDHYNCMYLGITNAKDVEIYEPSYYQDDDEEEEEDDDDVTIRGIDEIPLSDHQRHADSDSSIAETTIISTKERLDHTDEIYIELVNFTKVYYREFGKNYHDYVLHCDQSRLN